MKTYYDTKAIIRYYGSLPEEIQKGDPHSLWSGVVPENVPMVTGRLTARSDSPFDLRRWKEPPHVCFANLALNFHDLGQSLDPAFYFTKHYGRLGTSEGIVRDGRFCLDLLIMTHWHELLRNAWTGD